MYSEYLGPPARKVFKNICKTIHPFDSLKVISEEKEITIDLYGGIEMKNE